jgi:hypothetical protein
MALIAGIIIYRGGIIHWVVINDQTMAPRRYQTLNGLLLGQQTIAKT